METPYANTSHQLTLEVLTPTHVGGAIEKRWQEGLDYHWKQGGPCYILNQEAVYRALMQKGSLDAFSDELAKGDTKAMFKLIEDFRKPDIAHVGLACNFRPEREIYSLIQDGSGRRYLPGSSIKGAIRAVLATSFMATSFMDKGEAKKQIAKEDIDEKVFGKIENNLMRFLQIGDAYFVEPVPSKLYRTKIFNLQKENGSWQGGWKHEGGRKSLTDSGFREKGFVNTYECLAPTSKSLLTLSLKSDTLKFIENEGKKEPKEPIIHPPNSALFRQTEIKDLFRIINAHSRNYLKQESAFFNQYQVGETDEIRAQLKKLLTYIPDDDSYCVLHLGAGSGFHGITGDWLYKDDHSRPINTPRGLPKTAGGMESKHYKSRKIIFEKTEKGLSFFPMGFVKLSLGAPTPLAHALSAGQSSVLTVPAPPPPKEIRPDHSTKTKLKPGDVIDAVFVRSEGNQKVFTLFLIANVTQGISVRYPGELQNPAGVHQVKITAIDGKGNIQNCDYFKEKL